MNRRNFLQTASSAAVTAGVAGAAAASVVKIIELKWYRLRIGNQEHKTRDFLEKQFLPAAKRAGVGPIALLSGYIVQESPTFLTVTGYASLESIGQVREKMAQDREYTAARDAYNAGPELNYIRIDNALLRAFDSEQRIQFPEAGGTFELRTYESNNESTLRRKIAMFEGGEIDIFRKVGFGTVFFGEGLVGQNLPSMTYMLSFKDLTARNQAWSDFGKTPEWQKLRAQPGFADAEIVSSISNSVWNRVA